MKRILTLLLIIMMASCNKDTFVEDIISRHEDGSRKETFVYKVNDDGSKTKVRETWYYMEGMKHLDGPIVNDKRNGIFKTYYKSGELMSEGTFIDGVREGKAIIYREDGNIHYEGQYNNGIECGIWKFYNEKGELYREINRDIR